MQIAKPARCRTVPPSADTIQHILNDLAGFPALLPVVQKSLALLESPHTTAAQIDRVLCADPAMVFRVLKLANSAYFGVMTEVRTVSTAIQIIGFRKLQSLLRHVLVSGLIELLSQRRPAAGCIREQAVAASAACYETAIECGEKDPEESLVAGMLHNIGELAMLWSFPDEYEKVLQISASMPLSSAQKAILGIDSRRLGALLVESWQFPAIFAQAVEHWPDPINRAKDPALRRFLAIVNVGVALAQAQSVSETASALEISAPVCAELGLSQESLQKIRMRLPERIATIRAVLQD